MKRNRLVGSWGCVASEPRIVYVEDRRFTKNHSSLDDVLQLTNIPRPVIVLKYFQRRSINRGYFLSRLLGVALHEIFGEQRDILDSFAKRRNVDRKHIQTIVKVASEVAFVHVRCKIAIRRGQNADINLNRFSASDSLELPLLKYPQQRNLRFSRQVTDLVEE